MRRLTSPPAIKKGPSAAGWAKGAGENPDFAGLADSSYSYISVSPEDGVDAYFGYTPLENVENPDLVLAYGGNYRIRIVAGKEEKPGRR